MSESIAAEHEDMFPPLGEESLGVVHGKVGMWTFLVMDAMTLVSPVETERRATAFAAEFLAPIDDIAFDLDRVSVRTLHELDELRLTWGVSVASLVVRARERGAYRWHILAYGPDEQVTPLLAVPHRGWTVDVDPVDLV